MTARYRVTHTTVYAGDEPVSVGHNEARLRPRVLPGQHCLLHDLQIWPIPSTLSDDVDYFGNSVARFSFNQGYDTLTVTAISEVVVHPDGDRLAAMGGDPAWESIRDATSLAPEWIDASQFRYESPCARSIPELTRYARESFPPGRPVVDALSELTARIHVDFQFDSAATSVATPVADVWRLKRGVCQDFAHLQIAALRSLGLPARYVSGYLRTYPPPGRPRLVGADASHAWASVYCGEAGWLDFDPTNDVSPGLEHVTIGWGRDFGDVSPLKGVFIGGGRHRLTVSVDVEPIDEHGRSLD